MDHQALIQFIEKYGYLAIFTSMIVEGLGILVPSEIVMGLAGALVYLGQLYWPIAWLSGILGSMTGSFLAYKFARSTGRPWLYRHGKLIGLTGERLNKTASWFAQYGPVIIIPWRQLPVVRNKISLAAGLLDLPANVFLSFSAAGIALWCAIAMALGYYFGASWADWGLRIK